VWQPYWVHACIGYGDPVFTICYVKDPLVEHFRPFHTYLTRQERLDIFAEIKHI